MAANSLTDNDITSLAQIFDTSLQYYCKHISPLESEYVKKLSTIMGLGFTTVLVDGDLLVIYESRLQTFIRYRNFKTQSGCTEMLSRAIAEVISIAAGLFRLLGHQQYYDTFVATVENVATHVVVQESGKLVEAKRLLQLLFQKHY
jgi:hypothetical protein